MTAITRLEVRKSELSDMRRTETPVGELQDGQILVRIARFGLTANNVTYGVVGDRMGYWQFYPTADADWGVLPVWGIGLVEASAVEGIVPGERLYGYWPMASHAILQPDAIQDGQFFDSSEHRSKLAAVYNHYLRLSNDPKDDPSTDGMRMVLWPLYATSYCLYDFALDNDWFGANQVLIVSASSKTGIGTAYAFKMDPNSPRVVGLTSSGNKDKVGELGLYDDVIVYDEIEERFSPDQKTLIIDMSGSGSVIGRLHKALGDAMMFTSHVGLTHYTEAGMGDHYIEERSEMFFAPGHIAKRSEEWAPDEFERRSGAFWQEACQRSAAWLSLNHAQGADAAIDAYHNVLEGQTPADQSWTISIT